MDGWSCVDRRHDVHDAALEPFAGLGRPIIARTKQLHQRYKARSTITALMEEKSVLTVDQVTRVAEVAAADTSPDLRVAGVTLGGTADGAYVEILVNITGCRGDVCQVSIGVFRDDTAADLRTQIAAKLREHLAEHPTT